MPKNPLLIAVLLLVVLLGVVGGVVMVVLGPDEAPATPPDAGGPGGDGQVEPPDPVGPGPDDPDGGAGGGSVPDRPDPVSALLGDGPVEPLVRQRVGGPLFRPRDFDRALDGMDWPVIGKVLADAVRGLREYVTSVQRGEPPEGGRMDMHVLVRISEEVRGDFPSETPFHGAFLHPAFFANALEACLAVRGDPLTDRQARAVEVLLGRALEEEKQAADGPHSSWRLERVMVELERRQRFIDRVLEVVGEARHRALRPEAVRGRIGVDPFSTCEGWFHVVHVVPIPTDTLMPDEPVIAAADAVAGAFLCVEAFTGSEEDRKTALEIVRRFLDRTPSEHRDRHPSRMVQVGHLSLEEVREWASRSLELLHEFRAAGLQASPTPEGSSFEDRCAVLVPMWIR